jgi:phenylalanyl-tRNA synthetase beta chain
MKLSLDWLSDYVEFSEDDPKVIAERLTLCTAEVEEVEEQGALLDHCVVGKVLTLEKHPNADKLSLCTVETDKGKKSVVCGGTNLRNGMLVAFAHTGARVRWHGEDLQEITKAKIRGAESEGMICAPEELDLSRQFPGVHGPTIVDLGDSGYTVGTPLREALGLSDAVFHINNTAITTRPDLFSHIGFARECVALGLGTWKKKPEWALPSFPKEESRIRIHADSPELAPRYLGCMLEVKGLGETPLWMKRRLEATGWRCVNLPVDITNYIAMEIGVPLHSFDADDLKGKVHMRLSKKGEAIVTLDKVKRSLPDGALVLSDDEGIFDLLGIMGGLRSSTKEGTKHIYLHSTSLNPTIIRHGVFATAHRTEAATVYEKGVPPITTRQGFVRALELFLELIPGARVISSLESYGDDGKAPSLSLSSKRATHFLGEETSEKDIARILQSLDFSVAKGSGDSLTITPPLHRLGDIHETADILEEIARITGLQDSYSPAIPAASIIPPERDGRISKMRQTLKELGCSELVQFPFVGEKLLKKTGCEMKHLRTIQNPLGEDMKYMRPSLLPRLLEYASEHLEQTDETLRMFEVGTIFLPQSEETHLTLLIAEKRKSPLRAEPFLLTKSFLREVLRELSSSSTFLRKIHPTKQEHPVRSMDISLGKKSVGELFELHPVIAKQFGFPARVAIGNLHLQALLQEEKREKIHEEESIFPQVTYDVTMSPKEDAEVGALLQKAQKASPLLRSIALIDLYEKGKEGRRLTFRCTYGAPDRTLREEEVKPIHAKVEALLQA